MSAWESNLAVNAHSLLCQPVLQIRSVQISGEEVVQGADQAPDRAWITTGKTPITCEDEPGMAAALVQLERREWAVVNDVFRHDCTCFLLGDCKDYGIGLASQFEAFCHGGHVIAPAA